MPDFILSINFVGIAAFILMVVIVIRTMIASSKVGKELFAYVEANHADIWDYLTYKDVEADSLRRNISGRAPDFNSSRMRLFAFTDSGCDDAVILSYKKKLRRSALFVFSLPVCYTVFVIASYLLIHAIK